MLVTAFALGAYLPNIIDKFLYFLTCVLLVTSPSLTFSPLPGLCGIASMLTLRNVCTVLISSHSFDPRCLASFPTCRITFAKM